MRAWVEEVKGDREQKAFCKKGNIPLKYFFHAKIPFGESFRAKIPCIRKIFSKLFSVCSLVEGAFSFGVFF